MPVPTTVKLCVTVPLFTSLMACDVLATIVVGWNEKFTSVIVTTGPGGGVRATLGEGEEAGPEGGPVEVVAVGFEEQPAPTSVATAMRTNRRLCMTRL